MTIAHLRDLESFLIRLDAYAVPHNDRIEKILQLDGHLNSLRETKPLPDLADLTPDQLAALWRAEVATGDVAQTGGVTARMAGKLWTEALDALRDHVPTIHATLAKPFADSAKKVHNAGKVGITPDADAQAVMDLDDPKAVAAWRELRPNAERLSDIAALWVTVCETLGLPPTRSQAERLIAGPADHTVCFTHPDSGVSTGYRAEGHASWRWLSLAIATNGRLKLNTPDEVERALTGDGESPGWIICAAGAVVQDDEGRHLQLYRGAWIPSWVDAEQVDNLIDSGMVVAAAPGLERPADQYPVGAA